MPAAVLGIVAAAFIGLLLVFFIQIKWGLIGFEGYVPIYQDPAAWFSGFILPWTALALLYAVFAWVARRDWRFVGWTALVTVALSLSPVLVLGVSGTVLANDTDGIRVSFVCWCGRSGTWSTDRDSEQVTVNVQYVLGSPNPGEPAPPQHSDGVSIVSRATLPTTRRLIAIPPVGVRGGELRRLRPELRVAAFDELLE